MGEYQKPIYLDYHSTTPVEPTVLQAMLPFFKEHFGNPASRSHPFGWKASEAVELARNQVSGLLHVDAKDIFFSSGSTEGLNTGIKGLSESLVYKGKHIITIATEHHAALDPLNYLIKKGYEVTVLPVDPKGHFDLDQLESSIRNDTIMVVAMWANNETGVIHPVHSIGTLCARYGIAFVCDATQAVGKIDVHPKEHGIDFLVLSAHKFYGPKGTGAMYIDKQTKRIKPEALILGGGHENGFRSGTLNVPGIVGMGAAAELYQSQNPGHRTRIQSLRDHFEQKVTSHLEDISINGDIENRLHTVSNLKVSMVDSQAIMTRLRTRIAISSGSACSSADPSPSHVLLAMGHSAEEAKGSIRVSLGTPTTTVDMETAAEQLIGAIQGYRAESPLWQMFKQGKRQ